MWQAYPKKMYPKQCVVCWIPALLTLRLFPECAAGGEDCQAQTFFSFKYIIILWVSTCPCKVIDRADFLPSYENLAYEYVSTRTLKIIFYKKLNFLQILFDLISSGLRCWLNLEGKIGRFIILDNQQHKAFWPNQIQFFLYSCQRSRQWDRSSILYDEMDVASHSRNGISTPPE